MPRCPVVMRAFSHSLRSTHIYFISQSERRDLIAIPYNCTNIVIALPIVVAYNCAIRSCFGAATIQHYARRRRSRRVPRIKTGQINAQSRAHVRLVCHICYLRASCVDGYDESH